MSVAQDNSAKDAYSWDDLSNGLAGDDPAGYILDLQKAGVLRDVLPEVDILFGVPQNPDYHPEIDTGVHTLMALTKAAEMTDSVAVRFAVLTHDLGKGLTDPALWPKHAGHEEAGVEPILAVSERLGVPDDITQLAVNVSRYHLQAHRIEEMRAGSLVKFFDKLQAVKKPDMFEHFLMAVQADAQGRLGKETQPYPQADFLRLALDAASDARFDAIENSDIALQERVRAVRQVRHNYEWVEP